MFNVIISILGMLLTIFFVVGIHEFGHFITARALGIRVLRFSIGFGKTLLHFHDKKGTEYVFAAIPLGGYVKMLDEGEGPVPENQLHLAYNRQPLYKKMAVIIAGPLFNFIFAFLLYWLIFMVGFTSIKPIIGKVIPNTIAAEAHLKPQEEIISINQEPTNSWASIVIKLISNVGEKNTIQLSTLNPHSQKTNDYSLNLSNWQMDQLKPEPLTSLGIVPYEPSIPPIINSIQLDSPAAKSGLKIGDTIQSIENQPISDWTAAVAFIGKHPDKTLHFSIKRDDQILQIPVQIGNQSSLLGNKRGFLGIGSDYQWPKEMLRKNQYDPWDALIHAKQNTFDFIKMNFSFLGKMITGKLSLQSLGGPITIFQSAGHALNSGLLAFTSFLAFLSIAIGVINILPIPGLDGGHLLFYVIEFIIRRPLSQNFQTLFYRFGLIILAMLLVQALANDIMRL